MQISEGDIPGQVSDDIRPELILEAQACKFLLELLGTCLVLVRLLGLHCSNTKCPVSAQSAMETITCETNLHRKASRDAAFLKCRLCVLEDGQHLPTQSALGCWHLSWSSYLATTAFAWTDSLVSLGRCFCL